MVNLAIILATFAIILPAELPDKSMMAALVLGTRYRPWHVFAGVAAAFFVHVIIAVVAGSLLTRLPHRLLEIVVGLLFFVGAWLILKEHGGEEPAKDLTAGAGDHPSFWKVAGLGFVVIFIPEFGDLTQIATANLAAKFHDPLSVGIGSVLALWTAGAIGVWGGKSLLRVIPLKLFIRLASALLVLLGLASLVAALHG
jgi:putative Ca2+/H+ antiporter (TMEM165/GDT1 family)